MILIKLNRESKTPLFKQVFQALKERIDNHVLKPGERLPATRNFAAQLGVNRSTIYKAYEELWALGYIESKPGSYSTVRRPPELMKRETDKELPSINWKCRIPGNSQKLLDQTQKQRFSEEEPGTINFMPLSPDPSVISATAYRKCLNQVIRESGSQLLQYGDPMGYGPLRSYLSKRMKQHGIDVSSDQILITNGIQNGLDLIMKLLVSPGTEIFTEEPSYSAALPLFNYYQANITSIPMDYNGLNLKHLEQELSQKKPAFLYTMPNFHNPLGITTSQEHREKLLQLAEKYNLLILEDGFEEEMKYFGKAILPVKSMDKTQRVIYLGTFSKVLYPGLRVGWIAADSRLIHKLSLLMKAFSISGNDLDQAALHRFCIAGHYEHHLKRIHKIYRKRMQTAQKACRKWLSDEHIYYTQPIGGYTFWVEIRSTHVSEQELMQEFKNQQVAVCPGSIFHQKEPVHPSFRISIAHRHEFEIEEGIQRIAKAIQKFTRSYSPFKTIKNS